MSSYEIYIAYSTIVRKEIQRFMRIWVQTLLPPSIIMVLYSPIPTKNSVFSSKMGEEV